MKTLRAVAALALALAACLSTAQARVSYPIVAVPSSERSIVIRDWDITLTRADLAFGPVYFCASASGSSTLCGSAIAEMTSVARVDALGGTQTMGRVEGFTGHIASATYDLGLVWLDTRAEQSAAPEAPLQHSAVLEGEASKGSVTVPFVVLLDVSPQYQGQHAIATAPAFADVQSARYLLEVHLAPARWLAQVDFDAAAAKPERPLVFAVGSVEHSAVLVGLKSLAPPEFRWVAQP